MSPGSLLIGLALALVVGAWLARPFRRAADPDRAIEYWVARARAMGGGPIGEAEGRPAGSEPRSEAEWRPVGSEPRSEAEWRPAGSEPRSEAEWRPTDEVNFCPRCGRRVGPEDRFCARCGAPLPRP